MPPRSSKMSESQKRTIVNFMEGYPNLRKGKFDQTLTRKKFENMWKYLTAILNSMAGVQKDLRHWRKTWLQLKSAAKEKASKIARNETQSCLTDIEHKIICMIGGATIIEGHQGIQESPVRVYWPTLETNDNIERGKLYNKCPVQTTKKTSDDILNTNSNANESDNCRDIQQSSSSRLNTIYHKRRRLITKRLEHSIRVRHQVVDAIEKKSKIKEDYYTKKLKLGEMSLIVNKRISEALSDIISHKSPPNL